MGRSARPAPHRRTHRGRGEPGPPRASGRAPQHRLSHRVRILDGELAPAAPGGPPHHGAPREAVRSGRRAQRAERADPMDRSALRFAGRRRHRGTSSGRSARRSPTPRATPAWSSRWRSTTAAGPSWSMRSRRRASSGGGVTTRVDRRPSLPAGAAAGRRPRAHERRTPGVELPAVAVGGRGDLLHRRAVARVRRRRTRRRTRPRADHRDRRRGRSSTDCRESGPPTPSPASPRAARAPRRGSGRSRWPIGSPRPSAPIGTW